MASGDAEIRISFSPTRLLVGRGHRRPDRALLPKPADDELRLARGGTATPSTSGSSCTSSATPSGASTSTRAPKASLQWNKAEVYRSFSGSPNFWTKEQIDLNILQKYSKTQTNPARSIRDSIMLYHSPASLFLNNKATALNTKLSKQDKEFIAQMYPR